jgi:hypothetical protein
VRHVERVLDRPAVADREGDRAAEQLRSDDDARVDESEADDERHLGERVRQGLRPDVQVDHEPLGDREDDGEA